MCGVKIGESPDYRNKSMIPIACANVLPCHLHPTQEKSPEEKLLDTNYNALLRNRELMNHSMPLITPTQESTTWEEVAPLVERMKAKYPPECNIEGLEPALTQDICEIVSQAKRQEGERILEEASKKSCFVTDFDADGIALSDLTNIINNHD
jgi:hypothetical protein